MPFCDMVDSRDDATHYRLVEEKRAHGLAIRSCAMEILNRCRVVADTAFFSTRALFIALPLIEWLPN